MALIQDKKKWDWMLKCIEQPIRRYKDGGCGLSRSDVVHEIESSVKMYLKAHNVKIRKGIKNEIDELAVYYQRDQRIVGG